MPICATLSKPRYWPFQDWSRWRSKVVRRINIVFAVGDIDNLGSTFVKGGLRGGGICMRIPYKSLEVLCSHVGWSKYFVGDLPRWSWNFDFETRGSAPSVKKIQYSPNPTQPSSPRYKNNTISCRYPTLVIHSTVVCGGSTVLVHQNEGWFRFWLVPSPLTPGPGRYGKWGKPELSLFLES